MIARSAILTALAVAGLTAGAAFAQEATPAAPAEQPAAPAAQDPGAAYESARNQLGVLIYCQDKGHIGPTAVETQTKLLTMIPAGDTAKGDAAEAKGKQGTVSAMGVARPASARAQSARSASASTCTHSLQRTGW